MPKDNRTLGQFTDNLDAELDWRRQELSVLKNAIPAQESNPKQKSFIRAGITMLYAHWEGFVKNIATHYLNYVALRGLNIQELHPAFIARIMRGKANDKKQVEQEIERVTFVLNHLDKRAYISDTNINTKSNLKFKVFEEILTELGLAINDVEPFENDAERKEINTIVVKNTIDKLVADRNEIAHGKYLSITYEEFIQSYKLIMNVFETLKKRFIELAEQEKFKMR